MSQTEPMFFLDKYFNIPYLGNGASIHHVAQIRAQEVFLSLPLCCHQQMICFILVICLLSLHCKSFECWVSLTTTSLELEGCLSYNIC